MKYHPLGAMVALAVTVALTGCGLKGPLFLPEKAGEIVIRPAPPAADPAAPSRPAAETQPPSEQPQDPPDGPERG